MCSLSRSKPTPKVQSLRDVLASRSESGTGAYNAVELVQDLIRCPVIGWLLNRSYLVAAIPFLVRLDYLRYTVLVKAADGRKVAVFDEPHQG